MTLDHFQYLVKIEGLADVVDRSTRFERSSHIFLASGGNQEDGRLPTARTVRLAELRAGKAWHVDIEQDEIDITIQGEVKCVLSVCCLDAGIAFRVEQYAQEGTNILVIFSDEDDRDDGGSWTD